MMCGVGAEVIMIDKTLNVCLEQYSAARGVVVIFMQLIYKSFLIEPYLILNVLARIFSWTEDQFL